MFPGAAYCPVESLSACRSYRLRRGRRVRQYSDRRHVRRLLPARVAISKVLADKVPGVRPSVQATKGSVENLNPIQGGKGEIAFTLGNSLAAAVSGAADADPKRRSTSADARRNLSELRADRRLAGKRHQYAGRPGERVSVEHAKSGTELNARAILAGAGMNYEDLGKVEYLDLPSNSLVENRQLDASLQSAGLGVASIRDLGRVLIPLSWSRCRRRWRRRWGRHSTRPTFRPTPMKDRPG